MTRLYRLRVAYLPQSLSCRPHPRGTKIDLLSTNNYILHMLFLISYPIRQKNSSTPPDFSKFSLLYYKGLT